MTDTLQAPERLRELQGLRRRLRPEEQYERDRLQREADAEAAEKQRIVDRQAMKDSIERDAARTVQANELQDEISELDILMEEQVGDTGLMARRMAAGSRLAAIATWRRKDSFQRHLSDDRLVQLASPESREQLEYCRAACIAWCALVRILDDSRSDADSSVKAFVREQTDRARDAVGAARQTCINEE